MVGDKHSKSDKVEGPKPIDKAEHTKQPSADELYKDFQNMLKESAAKDSHSKPHVQDDQLTVEPVKYDKHGDEPKHGMGFISPSDYADMTQRMRDEYEGSEPKHGMGFISPSEEAEMNQRLRVENQRDALRVDALQSLNMEEQLRWGKGASEISPTIYQGDSAQLMDKVNGFESGIKDPFSNDLMKAMMTEAVLGTADGLKKIEKIAKELGLSEKQIVDMATRTMAELKKIGVNTNMTVLNTYVGEHGGAQERKLEF
ncbi:MAG: hypothetical protein K2Y22_02415 [Candidatus Obscuribacterales bacterium]|nr:hypothetical protein [Candidatus Obscuribacterales bacterium]